MMNVSEIAKTYKISEEWKKEILHTVRIAYLVGILLGIIAGLFGSLAILFQG